MNNLVKSTEQIEFAEIFERLKGHGVNQSALARELHITRSAVAMILGGDRNPRPATLAMLRELEKKWMDGDAQAAEIESKLTSVAELHDRINWLAAKDRSGLDVARRVIESLTPKQISYRNKKSVNSTAISEEAKLAKKAGETYDREHRKP